MEYPKGTWWHEPEVAYETGFKAGIKEVVDWLKLAAAEPDFMLDAWQAKLKEWGINP